MTLTQNKILSRRTSLRGTGEVSSDLRLSVSQPEVGEPDDEA